MHSLTPYKGQFEPAQFGMEEEKEVVAATCVELFTIQHKAFKNNVVTAVLG